MRDTFLGRLCQKERAWFDCDTKHEWISNMKKLLIENWRSYMSEIEREEKRIMRLQEAITAADPKIIQILQKEVEETAAILRNLFALNKKVQAAAAKAPDDYPGSSKESQMQEKLWDQIFKPWDEEEERLDQLSDAALDEEPMDIEKVSKTMDAWSDHYDQFGPLLQKLFSVAEKNGFKLDKTHMSFIAKNLAQDLKDAQQNLKIAMQGLKAAQAGNAGSAAAGLRR